MRCVVAVREEHWVVGHHHKHHGLWGKAVAEQLVNEQQWDFRLGITHICLSVRAGQVGGWMAGCACSNEKHSTVARR